jgi:hypothetical protein
MIKRIPAPNGDFASGSWDNNVGFIFPAFSPAYDCGVKSWCLAAKRPRAEFPGGPVSAPHDFGHSTKQALLPLPPSGRVRFHKLPNGGDSLRSPSSWVEGVRAQQALLDLAYRLTVACAIRSPSNTAKLRFAGLR